MRSFNHGRRIACALALALLLSGCEYLENLMDNKKPLPGERKAVFPEGVPGVPQGVPPELVKGYQAAPETAATPETGAALAGTPPGEPNGARAVEAEKPKPKPKKTAAKPPAQPSKNQAAWPGVPPAQSAPAPAPQSQPTPAWPAPQSQPTAAWPDPRQKPQQPAQ